MNILLVLKIIEIILQLIASGISESEAVAQASAKFGVTESLIRKFL